MSLVYLNGDYLPLEKATISVMDRGFLFADSVYEVIPVYHRRLFRHQQHLDRLRRSLAAIYLTLDMSDDEWCQIFQRLLDASIGDHFGIYLQITRGPQAQRNHRIPEQCTATVFVKLSPLESPDFEKLAEGLRIVSADDIRWQYCHIKSTALLANILLQQQAILSGADDAITFRDGLLQEGTSSNVFVIKDGKLATPPLGAHILGGVTREVIIDLAAQHHITCEQRDIRLEECQQADEIWLSSSTREIAPVVQLDGQPVGDGKAGPLWQSMVQYYQSYKATW